MKFSKDYSKLSLDEFTTIRKRSSMYWPGGIIMISTPTKRFKAEIISRIRIDKSFITDELARTDADCTQEELITILGKWYGKSFDDFVLLKMRRV